MTKIVYLKNEIDKRLKRCRAKNIAICCYITKPEEKKLSKWYKIERELFGFIKFTKKEDL